MYVCEQGAGAEGEGSAMSDLQLGGERPKCYNNCCQGQSTSDSPFKASYGNY